MFLTSWSNVLKRIAKWQREIRIRIDLCFDKPTHLCHKVINIKLLCVQHLRHSRVIFYKLISPDRTEY